MKIDRGCIERLCAYQSPPALVGTVMVMVMILLGRPEFSMYVSKKDSFKKELKKENSIHVSDSAHSVASSAKSKRPKEQRNGERNSYQ